jgi:hypothetical protein
VLAEHRQEEAHRADDDAGFEPRQRAALHLGVGVDLLLRPLEAAADGAQHVAHAEVAAHVQLRREANLDVEHVLAAAVPGELVGGALQRFGVLQAGDGELEPLQILGQVLVGALEHELEQAVRRAARQFDLVDAREIEQRLEPQAAVEVEVKVRLRQPRDEIAGEHGLRHGPIMEQRREGGKREPRRRSVGGGRSRP